MQTVKLSSKNQIVLPREAREAMHLRGRDELLVVVKGDVTVIMPKPESHRKAITAAAGSSYGEAYLEKEREAW